MSDLSRQLKSQLDRRREEVEARSRRDKQNFYQTLFERDMEAHKQSRLQQKTQGTVFSTSYISKCIRKISSGIQNFKKPVDPHSAVEGQIANSPTKWNFSATAIATCFYVAEASVSFKKKTLKSFSGASDLAHIFHNNAE